MADYDDARLDALETLARLLHTWEEDGTFEHLVSLDEHWMSGDPVNTVNYYTDKVEKIRALLATIDLREASNVSLRHRPILD